MQFFYFLFLIFSRLVIVFMRKKKDHFFQFKFHIIGMDNECAVLAYKSNVLCLKLTIPFCAIEKLHKVSNIKKKEKEKKTLLIYMDSVDIQNL